MCIRDRTTPTPTTETPTSPTNETTTNETITTEPPTPMDCQPQLLSLPGNSNQVVVEDLSMAVTDPKDSLNNPLCGRHEYPTLRHCSLFAHSHLRPFHADDIRTCMLPGTWYLLNHRDVTIQVTGVSDDIQSSYTRIDKAWHFHFCLETRKKNANLTIVWMTLMTIFKMQNLFLCVFMWKLQKIVTIKKPKIVLYLLYHQQFF